MREIWRICWGPMSLATFSMCPKKKMRCVMTKIDDVIQYFMMFAKGRRCRRRGDDVSEQNIRYKGSHTRPADSLNWCHKAVDRKEAE